MQPTPSLVLSGARMLPAPKPGADSVLIQEGTIRAIGPEAEVLARAPADAGRLHLDGRALSAGFHDAHLHFLQTGIKRARPSLADCDSGTEILEYTREACAKEPKRQALILEDWDETGWRDRRLPTRSELDALENRRPLILRRVCGHVALVNTRALEVLGEHGEGARVDAAAGRIAEGPVRCLDELFAWDSEELRRAFESVEQLCLSVGITTASDFLHARACGAYRTHLEGTDLRVPVNAYVLEEVADSRVARELPDCGGLRVLGRKLFADGSIGARTAALFDDYRDVSGEKGTLLYRDSDLAQAIRRGHEQGHSVAVHAIGDRAIAQVLEAFAAFPRTENRELRHRIEHFELPRPQDVVQLGEIGVRPCVQPNFVGQWAGPGGLYESALGAERLARMNPFRTLVQRETGVFFGSDGMPPSPLFGIRSAMEHPVESERLTFAEALRLYTTAAADALGGEPSPGRLELGSRADLTAWRSGAADSPLPENPRELGVDLTIVGGRILYRRGSLERLASSC